jgi:hypothetical protein
MKNYWIQVYEKKKKRIWTAEFSRNALFCLKPRVVDVVDPKYYLVGKLGQVPIIFKDAMFAHNDKELLNFLSDVHKNDMYSMVCRFRVYQGMTKEVENYELTGLQYGNLGSGSSVDDIKLTFMFKSLRHFHVA